MSLENTVSSVTTIIRGLIRDLNRTDGRDVFEYKDSNVFNLSEPYVSSISITVFQNGTELDSSDWTYDPDNNTVTISFITSGKSLNEGDIIMITYDYFKKYSDKEIEGYITSALSYFSENRYKKIFEINDNSEIVSCDDLDPTQRELYFISIISSILIDPMNIRVRTDDFTISANRDQSDREQISEAFTRYRRFVGEVDYTRRRRRRDKEE